MCLIRQDKRFFDLLPLEYSVYITELKYGRGEDSHPLKFIEVNGFKNGVSPLWILIP